MGSKVKCSNCTRAEGGPGDEASDCHLSTSHCNIHDIVVYVLFQEESRLRLQLNLQYLSLFYQLFY